MVQDILKDSHEYLLMLLTKAIESNNNDVRNKVFRKFALEMSSHLAAEEQHVLLPLERIEFLKELSAQAKQKQAIFEQQVEALLNLCEAHESWIKKANKLLIDMRAHFNHMEQEYYKPLDLKLSTAAKDSLINCYAQEVNLRSPLLKVA